jgi:hypothetical protein
MNIACRGTHALATQNGGCRITHCMFALCMNDVCNQFFLSLQQQHEHVLHPGGDVVTTAMGDTKITTKKNKVNKLRVRKHNHLRFYNVFHSRCNVHVPISMYDIAVSGMVSVDSLYRQ